MVSEELEKHFERSAISSEIVARLKLYDIFPAYRDRVIRILIEQWVTLAEAWDLRLREAIHDPNNKIVKLNWRREIRDQVFRASNDESPEDLKIAS